MHFESEYFEEGINYVFVATIEDKVYEKLFNPDKNISQFFKSGFFFKYLSSICYLYLTG